MTVDAKRKRRFQIKTQRLVRERESADEEDQIFNNQRFEQVNANNTAKMGSEVWQNLYEGTDCPQEFHKKVYAHNDRLVKDTSNAQEANQQTCRQCKNRFMCEQNYISDYVRDAHQKHEFHKKQIYEHEPKESGEVDSMNKISYNHSMNDINGDQVMVHEFPYQKQIYERDFQPHMQHEPKEKIVNQTFNLDNTINEAICGYNNYAHDVQSPEREVDSMNEINNSINEAICDYNNHAHDVQSPHQKQIYEHEFQQHEPKEKKVNQTFNLNNTINEAICDYNNHAHDVQFPHQKQIYEHEPKIDAAIDEAICDYNNHVHDSKFPLQKQIYEHEREVDSMNAINNSINEAISNYAHDVQFPHQKQIYEHEPKIDAAIDEAICDYNNHVHDSKFPLQKQIYEHEREVDSMNAINNSINEAISNYAHDVQFPHQKQIYEHEPKIDAAIDEASDYNNHVHDVQFLQFPSQKQIYEREPNINNDCNNHAHDVQKQTYEYEPKASGEVNSMNEVNNTINEAICDYNNHVYDVQFPLQKQIYKHEPKEKGDIDATNRPGYCYNNGTEKKDIKAFGLIKKTMEIYALDGQDYETINLGSNIFRETLAKDYPISQKRIQFKLGHCYDKVETETLKLIKRLNHSQDDILDAKQILNVLRFHTYSLFKNVFHNGIRKKLAFRKKNYCSRINRRNRRRYNPNLSIYRTKRC
ncbi:hypothetical protein RirG_086250 [Rhizophagus irregularis DAOM 197198w]|uniref:Uncharacterized protein n=4 Tax=Rhizophagus irregularis TaxID=588596 RepID=A0A015JM29_RHIIW|nr:hypothetical protein RirG_086250 [Rhizophagus irregularis DAOM 197198w]